MFCNRYPYTNLHNLNLNWILNVMRSYDDMTVKAEGGPAGVNIALDDDGNRTLTIFSPIFYPENLLDNSYFADPINQRNKTSYQYNSSINAIHGICIDRWRLGLNSTMDIIDDGVVVTGNFYQIIDNVPDIATLVTYDGNKVKYAQITFNGSPNSEKISGGKIEGKAIINLTSGKYVWAALLPGNVRYYEYQRKPREEELVKCLTKMQVYLKPDSTVKMHVPLFYGVGGSDGLYVTIPTTYRIDNATPFNFTISYPSKTIPTVFYAYNGNVMILKSTNTVGLTNKTVYALSLKEDAVIDGEPIITF